MNASESYALAKEIVDGLLDVAGESGTRLAIKQQRPKVLGADQGERDLGGWNRDAAIHQVASIIQRETR